MFGSMYQHIRKEAWYYMPAAKTVTQKDITSESMQLSATTSVDSGLLESITDTDHGFMRVGAMPAVETASAAGSKALLDAMGKACAKKSKTKTSYACWSSKRSTFTLLLPFCLSGLCWWVQKGCKRSYNVF